MDQLKVVAGFQGPSLSGVNILLNVILDSTLQDAKSGNGKDPEALHWIRQHPLGAMTLHSKYSIAFYQSIHFVYHGDTKEKPQKKRKVCEFNTKHDRNLKMYHIDEIQYLETCIIMESLP